MMTTIEYAYIKEFKKDFKKLEKRYRTLSEDFENMKKNLLETHYIKGTSLPQNSIVNVEWFCGKTYESKKIRKFTCKSLKNLGVKSGIRIIFVFEKENLKITFIEIYHKKDQEIENKSRLRAFIKENFK